MLVRVVTGVLLLALFLAFWALQSRRFAGSPTYFTPFKPGTHLLPAWTALVIGFVFIACVVASAYWLKKPNLVIEPAKVIELLEKTDTGNLDSGPLLMWACMYALTAGSCLAALWLAAHLVATSQAAPRYLLNFLMPIATIVVLCVVLAIMFVDGKAEGFGGPTAWAMVQGGFKRFAADHHVMWLIRMTLALNVVAAAVPLAFVVGACSLLAVIGRQWGAPLFGHLEIQALVHASRQLDWIFYTGAAALVAGTLQIST